MFVRNLGRRPYAEVWELQRETQQALIARRGPETLLVCEHPPTITLGKSSKAEHVLASPETLSKNRIEVFNVERGGDVTYHGPGQVVVYPIVDLRLRKRDVDWYMRLLEQAAIETLATFGVVGTRIKGKTGVWVLDPDGFSPRKIASLGVRISRWCTMHGLALNLGSVPGEISLEEGFSYINPCGLGDVQITSLCAETPASTVAPEALLEPVAEALAQSLIGLLEITPLP